MPKILGAAVIGLGVGKNHCEGYAKHPGAKLLAVSDMLDDRLNWAKEKYNVNVYKDYKKILARPDIDVVSIATPDFTHAKITIEALQSGKHVLVEKPMALKLEDCDRMIKAAKKSGRKLSVDFQHKAEPIYKKMKSLVDDGTIGNVVNVSRTLWRGSFLVKLGRWIQKRKYAGDMIFEEIIHSIDFARGLIGDISEVYALGSKVRKDFDYEDTVHILLKFVNGASGHISQSMMGNHGRSTTWIIGTKASIYHESGIIQDGYLNEFFIKEHSEDLAEDNTSDKLIKYISVEPTVEGESMALHVCSFVDAILEDKPLLVSAEDGRKAVEACMAADLSIQSGKIVKLPLAKTPSFLTETVAPPNHPYLSSEN